MILEEKNKIKFEEASKELDSIILKLEQGNLTLEESVDLYKRASELLKICNDTFTKAQGKITVIKNDIEQILQDED